MAKRKSARTTAQRRLTGNDVQPVKQRRKGAGVTTAGDAQPVEVADKPQREPCLCGCGGFPKGAKSRFIPGHDARYHSAQKKSAVAQ
jgi:hypothetical protein